MHGYLRKAMYEYKLSSHYRLTAGGKDLYMCSGGSRFAQNFKTLREEPAFPLERTSSSCSSHVAVV